MLQGFSFFVEKGCEFAYTMSKKDKLLKRLLSRPSDFTYEEAVTLLRGFGYVEDNKGKTSGSRVMFVNSASHKKFVLHKPHPGNILPGYVVNKLIHELTNAGFVL